MKKITSILLLIVLTLPNISAYDEYYGTLTELENNVLTFGGDNTCKDINESDIPTIFIPGILASWYSEEGFEESKIKRWIPDPITHSYDTLFYTFKQNEYNIRDVFYKDEFSTYIDGNPKQSLYLFGYDWKKDNKVSATILSKLVLQIREKYQELNGCDIGTVNIIGHSMGGLVARAMLEDMCVSNEDLKNYYKSEEIDNKNYYVNPDNKVLDGNGIKQFNSVKCNNYTKINQLITISTPHRGSPGSFPMWSKGDMEQTTDFIQSKFLKGQLGTLSDTELYNVIHGNTSKVPNGIVTIGQLLPDIKKNNNFNKELIYLSQKGNKLDNKTHPVNSFLEELNSDENIEKMFKNINKKHTLYYSTITSNVKQPWYLLGGIKNNIVGFELEDKYLDPVTSNLTKDKTSTYRGKDIYSTYSEIPRTDVYNIDNKIINNKGLGGDGTVPSKNLLLTSNNTGKRPDTSKYESIEIKCYDDELLSKNNYDLEESEEILSKKVGKLPMELCSHTKMPMLTSVKVLEKISGFNILKGLETKEKFQKEQELLYKYLGYAYYGSSYITENDIKIGGIKNSDKLSYRFSEGVFNTTFTNQKEIDDFIDNKDEESTKRKELTFNGQLGAVDSLLRYEILSPINLIIEDEQGRKIGIDPETGLIINEIPGAWTSGDTEGSNEPEFFLIPRTGTGEVNHKITSYPTGEGEYHVVFNEIKTSPRKSPHPNPLPMGEGIAPMVIEGYAKEGVIEEYEVGINDKNATFRKSGVSKLRLDRKYKDIFEKIILIIEDKYSERQKKRLGDRLSTFKELGYGKFSGNEKIVYLVGELVDYLR